MKRKPAEFPVPEPTVYNLWENRLWSFKSYEYYTKLVRFFAQDRMYEKESLAYFRIQYYRDIGRSKNLGRYLVGLR